MGEGVGEIGLIWKIHTQKRTTHPGRWHLLASPGGVLEQVWRVHLVQGYFGFSKLHHYFITAGSSPFPRLFAGARAFPFGGATTGIFRFLPSLVHRICPVTTTNLPLRPLRVLSCTVNTIHTVVQGGL
jgi:hypothetical protein